MEAVTIREAEPADVDAVLALVEGAFRGESAKRGWSHEADLLGGQRTDAAALGAIASDPLQTILLAENPEFGLVGCVHVSPQGADYAYLGMLTVRPDLQGGGLGRRLLDAAEEHARRALGVRRMRMTVIKQRPELFDYYERRGYRNTGKEEPFPLDDPRYGLPKRRDLVFVVLEKSL